MLPGCKLLWASRPVPPGRGDETALSARNAGNVFRFDKHLDTCLISSAIPDVRSIEVALRKLFDVLDGALGGGFHYAPSDLEVAGRIVRIGDGSSDTGSRSMLRSFTKPWTVFTTTCVPFVSTLV